MSGPILNLPIADYHASDFISSTKLLDLEPCPLLFKRKHVDKAIPRKDSAALDVGNGAHWRILEGEAAYNERVIVCPDTYPAPESAKKDAPIIQKPWNWNANFCKDWAAGVGGKLILSKAECALIDRLGQAVKANPVAAALLTKGLPEVTFRKDLGLFGVQCRTDYWHADGLTLPEPIGQIDGPVIVDLKTCETIERFERDFFDLRYHCRAEFYRLVIRESLAEAAECSLSEIPEPAFFFVAVEKSEPHRCEVFRPDADSLARGKREVNAALVQLADCYRTGIWPGSRPGVQTIGLKTWQAKLSDEQTTNILEGRAA